ncbi:MAG TPA: O-methyltransferase [Solirubrobacteraceae bacterium]|nr:O-methyltransferase [Solirubrobacteraceae bacterium]
MAELIDPAADAYATEHTTAFEGAIAAAAAWTRENKRSPEMMAGLAEARLLEALAVATGARRVLELGTFTGVGALALAASLAPDGRVTTIEVDPTNAEVARRHIEASPYANRIELLVGDARELLEGLEGPYDLVWMDAWKSDYPAYWDLLVPMLAVDGMIAADNLFWDGAALDPMVTDPSTVAIREFARRVQDDPRVHNVLLTIGDGVMLAWRSGI